MEFSYWDHEVKSDGSSWPADAKNNNDDEEIVLLGRSYECVFCKRGFTTAQALGGHMNIHRKDKVVVPNKHTSSCTYNKLDTNNNNNNSTTIPRGTSSYYSTTTTAAAPPPPHQAAYYFPPAAASSAAAACVPQGKDNKVLHYNINTTDEDALDLELRLGHHHHHP